MYISKSYKKALFIMFAIPIIYLAIWRIFPAFYTIYLSMTEYNMIWGNSPVFTGISNYIDVLTDSKFLNAIKLSLLFAIIAVSIEYVLGFVLALILDSSFRGKNFILGILIMPMILTPAVVGVIWYILYNDRIGPLNYFLSLVGISPIEWISSTSTAFMSVIIADVWQWTPFIFLLIFSTLQTIPQDIYEASRVDGANWWHTVRFIKIPLLKTISITAILLRFMDAFREFDKVYIMTGGGPGSSTELATTFVFKSAFKSFDMGIASAMAVILLVFITVLYSIVMKYIRM
ncbi:sugar ABC transporter permease [Bacillaceae bacterium CLA-AA-H227]|uniref:Sugar ABC transporter permease n=1 Tax=Robertmurraya yapensis (ex Hitch et al 2024) TaxID=3133160 RepID=A0ACC6SFP5_9BACI